MFRNLIFDWSGTLVDDLPPVLDATNHVLSQYGLPTMDREEFRRRFRLPYVHFYAEILPDVPLSELETHFRAGFAASTSGVTLLPHTRDKLAWCRARGIRTFVVTSMDAPAFYQQLESFQLTPFFEATYASVLDKREQILEILETHQLRPEDSAFIGDMVHDIETAHHAQLTSVAVLSGYTHPEPLAAAKPDITVQDISGLRKLMERPAHPPRAVATQDSQPVRNANDPMKPDTITIKGLKLRTKIGVPDAERAAPQELEADLRIEPNQAFAAMADDLDATVDYHAVCLGVEALAAEGERQLIESLAHEIAQWVLDHFPAARRVRVELRKFILPQTRWVSVETRLTR